LACQCADSTFDDAAEERINRNPLNRFFPDTGIDCLLQGFILGLDVEVVALRILGIRNFRRKRDSGYGGPAIQNLNGLGLKIDSNSQFNSRPLAPAAIQFFSERCVEFCIMASSSRSACILY
jgi:hypothetical protein